MGPQHDRGADIRSFTESVRPQLDGALIDDDAVLRAVSIDFGNIVHHRPAAVLRPGSAADVAAVVKAANAFRIKVAARGAGHSCYGQSQAGDGVVVDMTALTSIGEVRDDRIEVATGATWSAVVRKALEHGLTPPVLTDYLGVTVGGTLSVGGIGGTSYGRGLQLDNVLELEVVTGDGAIHTCSPDQERGLFDSVRAGLGQFGIITRATLRLVPAPARVRRYHLDYDSAEAATADQLTLIRDGRFDFVQGHIVAADGRWRHLLEVVRYYTPPETVDNDELLHDLNYRQGSEQIDDLPYWDFMNRIAASEEYLLSTGEWLTPHPWWNAFLPVERASEFLDHLTDTIAPAEVGDTGLLLFYPVLTEHITAPFYRTPDAPITFLVSILQYPPDDPDLVNAQLAANLTYYRRARAQGGLTYPIGAIPFEHEDWQHHFGSAWPDFLKAKNAYDPNHLFAPGQEIF
ncbi:FAD-binding protein [Nocardia terpenica]|uniref:FAD-binding protein n=1 Tax=Nocardia terpenica TaxID=455432 RepID=A0A6G9Z4R6_9NOCA|nr:FAD-binding protein [Nocardia terpenica]QIS20003.1 FAD-binding protein [Nocardia terpenica]